MRTGRLEAFSDGVIAILITIMVLELKQPHGDVVGDAAPDAARAARLRPELHLPRHLLEQPPPPAVGGRPRHRRRAVGEPAPAVLAVAGAVRDGLDERERLRRRADGRLRHRPARGRASPYYVLQTTLLRAEGRDSRLAMRSGRTSRARRRRCSTPRHRAGVPSTAGRHSHVRVVALMWLVPDRRVERLLADPADDSPAVTIPERGSAQRRPMSTQPRSPRAGDGD